MSSYIDNLQTTLPSPPSLLLFLLSLFLPICLAIVNIYTLYGELGSNRKLLQKKREKSKWSNGTAYSFWTHMLAHMLTDRLLVMPAK